MQEQDAAQAPEETRRKLVRKTATLLRNLRSKHGTLRNGKSYQQDEQEAQVVTSLETSDQPTSEEDLRLPPLSRPRQPHPLRTAIATILGKRRRTAGAYRNMAAGDIKIHEDSTDVRQRGSRKMSVQPEEDAFEHESERSESDDEVDESVLDDMRKLEESFHGISSRYRLVNRIGEGRSCSVQSGS
jgi:hypothetical protein